MEWKRYQGGLQPTGASSRGSTGGALVRNTLLPGWEKALPGTGLPSLGSWQSLVCVWVSPSEEKKIMTIWGKSKNEKKPKSFGKSSLAHNLASLEVGE